MKERVVMFTVNAVDFMGNVHATSDADVFNLVDIYRYVEQAVVFKDNDRVEIMDDNNKLVLVICSDSDALEKVDDLLAFYY